MMKQPHSGERHYDSISVTRFNYIVISNRASRLYYETDSALGRTLNIVSKGEECVRTQRYTADFERYSLFSLSVSGSGFPQKVLPNVGHKEVLPILR